MSNRHLAQAFITLALLLATLLSSCARQGTAPSNSPHATVLMRDGSRFSGTVTASSPDSLTLLGEDNASHTVSMAQVSSVNYDAPQPLSAGSAPVVDSGVRDNPVRQSTARDNTASENAAAARDRAARDKAARDNAARDNAARTFASREDAIHEEHYHPPRSAIQTRTYTLPAGAQIPVRTEETIDAAVATEGQTYAAEVTRDVVDDAGAVVIPHGSNAQVVIRSSARGGRFKGVSDLVLDLDTVSVEGRLYRLDTQDVLRRGRDGVGRNRRTGEFAGGGAAIGAIIGAIAGGGRGAAIGAASGAGAGAGAQIITKGSSIRIPAETILTFQLAAPLRVDAAN